MSEKSLGDPRLFKTIINHEEQWSIWPEDTRLPSGWRYIGTSGSREDCLRHIEEQSRQRALAYYESLRSDTLKP
ncbi:MAG TPA: MbtH family NRPS accessory protein [Acidobacteriota bacterium]|nr:MbtH family NRPS accessory protein [Acidobacteriota bacterium]